MVITHVVLKRRNKELDFAIPVRFYFKDQSGAVHRVTFKLRKFPFVQLSCFVQNLFIPVSYGDLCDIRCFRELSLSSDFADDFAGDVSGGCCETFTHSA